MKTGTNLKKRLAISVFLLAMSSGIATAQSPIQPPEGMVSWWPGDGSAEDIVGENEGTLGGGVMFANGMVGEAFSFDGIGEDEGVWDYHSFQVFTPSEAVLRSCYTFKRNFMAAFMEKRGIEARNGHSFGDETLQSHFSKDTFPHHQLSGHQIRDSLTQRDRLPSYCNFYSARTLIDNLIQEKR